ncbi:hypothetical protein OG730_41530 (plasmid) [Streptomyces sp. NBC_01298]|uniref:hypothetical protein n=1 Tax=Streptomyces sp. NBC_01298 TaxID=2903817 RepID=UPI002E104298|nr:hypothetical protein OG730_42495 [Streptomyces sp. NBC_01298]WSK25951.1 hypothetical protein OG730_41530 [Streptomyces sp. NBC_01298]
MQHQTTINDLAALDGLFTLVDRITVPETDPSTGITEEVTLPPPLIRTRTLRDDTVVFVLTPPGIHERIHVADGAPVTVYYRTPAPAPAPASGQHSAPAAAAPHQAAPPQHSAPWPQPTAPQAQPQAQQPAPAPRRPAAPWQ